jgi:large subunit ribosomal protein L16
MSSSEIKIRLDSISGKKLGGGKGGISHYTTPVKRGRVIIEVGGSLPLEFLWRVLIDVAQKLPFPAKVVSQNDLDEWEKEKLEINSQNLNRLRWEWCVKNNVLNVLHKVGKYDVEFSHLGPNCR